MGEEIEDQHFTEGQDQIFLARVREETAWLKNRLQPKSYTYKRQHGYELEGYLIDKDGLPASRSQDFLAEINDSAFVHEIAQFNWEINGDVFQRTPHLLHDFLKDIDNKTLKAKVAANKLGLKTLFIGILPTLREDVLTLEHMSQSNRYYALTERLIQLRGGKNLKLQIDRNESVTLERSDVMTEAAATSLQIHTQVSLEDSVALYNISQILAAPLVAASANSPFFLGQKLWDETRIPVFEQSVQFNDAASKWSDPVTLGQKYCENSLIEIFEENQELYPALLPYLFDQPIEKLRHLKLLNGQVWRWNRPIVNAGADGHVQLRIEHRPLPAGPSNIDMVANIGLYTGLLAFYKNAAPNFFKSFSFSSARNNFYKAAKMGMKADIEWGPLGNINMQTLLHDVLFDQACEGLKLWGISAEDIQYFMHTILKPRLRTGFTGAAWQKSFIDLHGADFQNMTLAYYELQNSGDPVHKWKV